MIALGTGLVWATVLGEEGSNLLQFIALDFPVKVKSFSHFNQSYAGFFSWNHGISCTENSGEFWNHTILQQIQKNQKRVAKLTENDIKTR